MTHIGLLSDTHGYLHPRVFEFFGACDEVWHAGDIGNIETADRLTGFKPFRAVYGNIDGGKLRVVCKENAFFQIEEVKVLMMHIGGYPGRYSPKAKELIIRYKPDLFVSGHSHILKVMPDNSNNLLHINPGAAGNSGFHKFITMVRFTIDGGKVDNLEVLEIKR